MKLLLTGGAGFIGSNLVDYILKTQSQVEIVVLDNLSAGSDIENLDFAKNNSRFKFVHGNICDETLVNAILSGKSNHGRIDGVLHLAAESHVDRSIEAPLGFVHTNIFGTANLLHHSYLHDIEKFLYVSTDEVYGSSDMDTGIGWSETSPLLPNSPYSASKASGDNLARAWFETYELPVVVSRSANNYGPNQATEKLIPKTITSILRNEPVPIYGNGQNKRDWLHVRDHCRALMRIFILGEPGQIYNVAANNEISNFDLVLNIIHLMRKDDPRMYYKFVMDRPGHDLRYFMSADKIRNELSWEPEEDFITGLKETINYYKARC